MAALFATQAGSRVPSRAARAHQTDAWRADRFINVALPGRAPGARVKMGTLKLKLSRVNEASLIEWLDQDAGNLEALRAHMVLELSNPNEAASDGSGLDLGSITGAEVTAPARGFVGRRVGPGVDEQERAARFINVSVPTVNGGSLRLGGLPLYASNRDHAVLIQWLEADESNLESLREKFLLDYRHASGNEGSGVDFAAMARRPAPAATTAG